MRLKKSHKIGLIISGIIMLVAIVLAGTSAFFFVFGISLLVAALPFVMTAVHQTKIASEKEVMFLEFSRNLVESVKAGTPISKSIINMRTKSYGVLTENIKKLANQISLGIPLNPALQVFAKDVNNKTVSRALTLIGQAERAGGNIGEILESVTEAVSISDKLKKERKATISTLVVQGYIIFFVFIIIVLVMQFAIMPMMGGIGGDDAGGGSAIAGLGGIGGISVSGGAPVEASEMANAFLYLLLIQGLFTGLTIGKLSEGNAKAGLKHSFALVLSSFLISAGANLVWGV
ncbi:MAG: type II secretion system F family protein [Nanoarchaeota archaeon]|nr:type II secretion system F family protein [Nanoarchaeota archaeon]